MGRKKQLSIGLEIGDGHVKVLEVLSTPKQGEVVNYAKVPVNFREGRDGIVNAIKYVLQQIEVKKNAKVNIAVSGESVMVRDIHWPEMNDADIRKALQFEVERQTNCKSEDIVFDYYSIVDKTLAEAKTRVVLVAAKKDLIENYVGLVEAAGYGCGLVEVDTFSLLNCFYANGPEISADRTLAIVNVGMEVTNIDIIRGKIVGLTKDAFVAWSNLVDALPPETTLDFNNIAMLKGLMGSDDVYELCLFITNALGNQVRRTIEFYESQGRFTVDEVYLSGKMAGFANLDKYLQNVLGLPVKIWNPLGALKIDSRKADTQLLEQDAAMLAICGGLASYRELPINLLAGAGKESHPTTHALWEKIKPFSGIVVLLALIFFFLGGAGALILNQVALKQRAIKELTDKNKELLEVVEEVRQLESTRAVFNEQIGVIRELFSRRTVWAEKLNAISDAVPEKIWLTDMRVQVDEKRIPRPAADAADQLLPGADVEKRNIQVKLFLKGVVAADEMELLTVLNEFINKLRKDAVFMRDFKRIDLVRSYMDVVDKMNVMRFELIAEMKDSTR